MIARPRIVVAVDADSSDLPLEIARHFLSDTATELVGLFVEDRRLFEHATAALAREVAYTGRAGAFEKPKLERQLRARATEARRQFEAIAKRLAIAHDFQVLRGDIVSELVREAASAEALVVGYTAEAGAARTWSSPMLRELLEAPLPALLVARTGWRTGHGVVVVFDRHTDSGALDAGVRFARRSRSPLTVLVAAGAAADRQALMDSVQRQLSGADVELHGLLPVANCTLETIRRAARGARLVVLAHGTEPRAAELAAELVVRTPLSLLIVRSSDALLQQLSTY